jgi:hypothetical protein
MYLSVNPPIAFPLALEPWRLRGLGANTLPVSTGVEEGTAAALTAVASTLAIASASPPSPATPFLLAAAGIATLLAKLGVGSGCGQTCIQATAVVNQAEPALLANIQQYEAGQISQEQAIATFNNVWQGIQVSCSAIPGQAGQDCVTDRQQGSCKWKQTTDSPLLGYPGEPQPGDCWNWFSGYYTPLTLPPFVAQSPSASGTVSSITDSLTSEANTLTSSVGLPVGSGTLLLLAAAALAVVLVVS